MDYYLLNHRGNPLEARITVEQNTVTLHSRSGRPRNALPADRGRNPDYVEAFDALFARINQPTLAVERVLLDSAPAQSAHEDARVLASKNDFQSLDLEEIKRQIRTRMRAFGRKPGLPANEGNQNKKIRVDTNLSAAELVPRLRLVSIHPTSPSYDATFSPLPRAERWPTEVLRKVAQGHVNAALTRLDAGEEPAGFGPSRDYDAMTSAGRRYAPKQLFGFALQEATGTAPVSANFSAGWGTPCFEILEECGLWIVPKHGGKGTPRPSTRAGRIAPQSFAPTDEERTWVEGNPRMATHLVRERHPGLSKEKREHFEKAHGKLFCEMCGLEPAAVYGPEAGDACIEVHHARTQVAHMEQGHETSLDDLQCLCANCHRVLHRAISLGVPFVI